MQLLKTRATLVAKLILPRLGNKQNRPCLSDEIVFFFLVSYQEKHVLTRWWLDLVF